MEIRCADCDCLPFECKASPSPRKCLNCKGEEYFAAGVITTLSSDDVVRIRCRVYSTFSG